VYADVFLPGRKGEGGRFKWKVFVAGLAAIGMGYVFLAASDITIAPILLVLGYCVLVPLAFL
jgi:hypothetical protein